MSAPDSAAKFTNQLMNNNAPLAEGVDAEGNTLASYITHVWRYVFAQFAVTTTDISPTWTQTVSSTPTQAEVQAIVAQVELLSKQLGR